MNYLIRIVGFLIMVVAACSVMPGGISDTEKPVTEELKKTLEPIQPELNAKVAELTNGPVDSLEPVSYKSQIVAGVNYFVKYRIGSSNQYVHARIYRHFSGTLSLTSVSKLKSADEPILYF